MSGPRRVAAFYAPLKHPFQREASGDSHIARTLMDALRGLDVEPELASGMLTWRRTFDPGVAARLERMAAMRVETLVRRYRRRPTHLRPSVWITYQNYHRCPDLLGPAVATALEIPYVLVDTAVSSASRRSAFRPWVSAARLALRRADLIFAMSPRDVPRLARLRGPWFAEHRLCFLPPAVDVEKFETNGAPTPRAGAEGPLLLCVAMMRVADKLDSYRLLAGALARLHAGAPDRPWRLLVVGDGPARGRVEAELAALPAGRVSLCGSVEREALPPIYRAADIFAFPGLGDALGLVYLEAAAAGLPVVACRGPGPEVMVAPDGGVLTDPTSEAFAAGLRSLMDDPARRRAMGAAARRFVVAERTLDRLRARLRDGLARLGLT